MKRLLVYSVFVLLFAIPLAGVAQGPFDPTAPQHAVNNGSEPVEVKPSLRLQSVFVKEGKAWAIISDTLLHVGQTISGYKLTGISSNGVTLIKAGESLELELYRYEIKK